MPHADTGNAERGRLVPSVFVSTDMYLKVHQGPNLLSFNVVSNRKFQGHFKWCGQ